MAEFWEGYLWPTIWIVIGIVVIVCRFAGPVWLPVAKPSFAAVSLAVPAEPDHQQFLAEVEGPVEEVGSLARARKISVFFPCNILFYCMLFV